MVVKLIICMWFFRKIDIISRSHNLTNSPSTDFKFY